MPSFSIIIQLLLKICQLILPLQVNGGYIDGPGRRVSFRDTPVLDLADASLTIHNKMRMEARTAEVESEYGGSGEEYDTEVAENSKIIRVLMNQMCGLQKTVMERLPEQKGR